MKIAYILPVKMLATIFDKGNVRSHGMLPQSAYVRCNTNRCNVLFEYELQKSILEVDCRYRFYSLY